MMQNKPDSLPQRMAGAALTDRRGRPWRLPTIALNFAERRLLLALGDVLALNGALGAALAVRPDLALSSGSVWVLLFWSFLLTTLWFVFSSVLNVYDLNHVADVSGALGLTCAAALLTGVVYMLIPYVSTPLPQSRLHILLFPVAGVAAIIAWRLVYDRVFMHATFQRRALILGVSPAGQYLTRTISEMGRRNSSANTLGYQVIGFVDDARTKSCDRVDDLPVLGTFPELPQLIRQHRPDEIVVAVNHWPEDDDGPLQSILAAQEMGVRITTMTMVYEQLTGRLALEQTGQRFDIVLPMRRSAGHRIYLAARRLTELLFSLVGCLLVLVVIPFIWLGNRFISPGPLFLRQERVGQGGRPFQVIKFRSMVVDAEKHTGAVWATTNDPRITPIGRFLRKTRLDEIPQFWNVLIGEMSLIGPRPERPLFVAQLSERMPFYRVRHCVRPGLTGWAQVRYHYTSSVDDALIKLQYDLYYIKHRGALLDLLIVLKTAQIVLGFKGH